MNSLRWRHIYVNELGHRWFRHGLVPAWCQAFVCTDADAWLNTATHSNVIIRCIIYVKKYTWIQTVLKCILVSLLAIQNDWPRKWPNVYFIDTKSLLEPLITWFLWQCLTPRAKKANHDLVFMTADHYLTNHDLVPMRASHYLTNHKTASQYLTNHDLVSTRESHCITNYDLVPMTTCHYLRNHDLAPMRVSHYVDNRMTASSYLTNHDLVSIRASHCLKALGSYDGMPLPNHDLVPMMTSHYLINHEWLAVIGTKSLCNQSELGSYESKPLRNKSWHRS